MNTNDDFEEPKPLLIKAVKHTLNSTAVVVPHLAGLLGYHIFGRTSRKTPKARSLSLFIINVSS